jgi:hypothetical protein
MEAKEELIGQLKTNEEFFYQSFKKAPEEVISLFNTLDYFIELVKTKPFSAFSLVNYKNGTEVAKLIKTYSDFLKVLSVHDYLGEHFFVTSVHIQSLFNTPDSIIQLAIKSTSCALHVLSLERYEEVRTIFSNYQINEHLLELAGMKDPNNAVIVIHFSSSIAVTICCSLNFFSTMAKKTAAVLPDPAFTEAMISIS